MSTHVLANHVTVALRQQGALFGFGFAEPLSDEVQRQHWVLWPGYLGPPGKHTAFVFAQQQFASLQAFLDAARTPFEQGGLWKAGSHYAKGDFVLHGEVPSMLPNNRPATRFPAPFSDLRDADWQIDYGTSQAAPQGASQANGSGNGFVFGDREEGSRDAQRLEYWALDRDYAPPARAGEEMNLAAPGNPDERFDTLGAFVGFVRDHMQARDRLSGLVIGYVNYYMEVTP